MDIHIFAKIFSQQLRSFIVKIMILRTQTVFISKTKETVLKVNSLFFIFKHSESFLNQKKPPGNDGR